MKAVKQIVVALSLGALASTAAFAASSEDTYLRTFSRGPGVPEPVKVIAPTTIDAPAGASAMVAFVVDLAGVPQAVTVAESNHEAFAAAAVEAVKQWRFTPVVKDGVVVETKVLLPMRVGGEPVFAGSRLAAR